VPPGIEFRGSYGKMVDLEKSIKFNKYVNDLIILHKNEDDAIEVIKHILIRADSRRGYQLSGKPQNY
jgi:hypothetical protein